MTLQLQFTMSLNETGYSPWIDTNTTGEAAIHIHVPSTGAPVGAWTFELSNDLITIDLERQAKTTPANSTAKFIDGTIHLNSMGTDIATGFDGAADRATLATMWPCPGAFRLKWTHASGTGTAFIYVAGR